MLDFDSQSVSVSNVSSSVVAGRGGGNIKAGRRLTKFERLVGVTLKYLQMHNMVINTQRTVDMCTVVAQAAWHFVVCRTIVLINPDVSRAMTKKTLHTAYLNRSRFMIASRSVYDGPALATIDMIIEIRIAQVIPYTKYLCFRQ